VDDGVDVFLLLLRSDAVFAGNEVSSFF